MKPERLGANFAEIGRSDHAHETILVCRTVAGLIAVGISEKPCLSKCNDGGGRNPTNVGYKL